MVSRRHLTKTGVVEKGLAIDTGLCTMCGLCVAVCPAGALRLISSGTEPSIAFGDRCHDCGLCYRVCPGRNVPLRDLDSFVFGRERDLQKELLGISRACYQANATDPAVRARGASGGVVTALLVYALEQGLVSAATVVTFDREQPWKAKPVLATTRQEIIEAAESKYVIVPVNAALAGPGVKKLPGPIAGAGLPCHIHGLRKLQYLYPDHFLSKKIALTIGIHCGSAKSMMQNEAILKKHFGLRSLDEIKSLSYRKGKMASAHAEVVKTSGEVVTAPRYVWSTPRSLIAGRCTLCWDWSAELSDVSVGDFFGPAASGSEAHLGASTLIVRTERGERLVAGAVAAGYLKVYPTPVEPVLRCAGITDKKLGHAWALMACQKYGVPCPDYQYQIEPMAPLDRVSFSSVASIEEREQFWAQRGVHPLA